MKNIILLCISGILALLACSSSPAPKDTVFDFIDAVLNSDSLRVVKDLDLDAYIKSRMTAMSPEDSAKTLEDYRVKTIESLLGTGETRMLWSRSQIIVNEETISDGRAEVEVTFGDKETGHYVYTKMQLQKQPDKTWKVIYFK